MRCRNDVQCKYFREATKLVITIDINSDQKCVTIITDEGDGCAQASLLTIGGEEAERFSLHPGPNPLLLGHYPAGTYSLRIECEKEVVVRQVVFE